MRSVFSIDPVGIVYAANRRILMSVAATVAKSSASIHSTSVLCFCLPFLCQKSQCTRWVM